MKRASCIALPMAALILATFSFTGCRRGDPELDALIESLASDSTQTDADPPATPSPPRERLYPERPAHPADWLPDEAEDVGYQMLPGMEEKVVEGAFWQVRGRLIDLLHLEPLTGGTVLFTYSRITVEAPTGINGSFKAELPQLEEGGYLVMVEPPEGFEPHPHVATRGTFAAQPYRQRLMAQGAVPFQGGLREARYNLEIALFPSVLTPEERDDYQNFVRDPLYEPPDRSQ